MAPSADRRLTTVLFLDIVGSTAIASDMGDRGWQELLARFRRSVRAQLRRFGGHEEDTAGDGFFVTFPEPARALRAARAIVADVQELGLEVRCGLHFGEAEVRDGKLSGIAVHIGARVMSVAGAAEILVTSTIRDLVAGAGVEFEDLSVHELKGVPGTWQLSAVRKIDGEPLPAALPAAEAAQRIAAVQPEGVLSWRRPLLIGGGVIAAVVIGVTIAALAGGGGEKHSSGGSSAPTTLEEAALRLDPETGKVTTTSEDVVHGSIGNQRSIVRGGGGGDIAAGDHEIWVAGGFGQTSGTGFIATVQQIDPQTDRFFGQVRLPGGPFGAVLGSLAIGGGHVWCVYSNRVATVDEGGHEARAIRYQGAANDVAAFGSTVWIVDQLRGTLTRIDPASGKVADIVSLGSTFPQAVGVGPAGTWVVDSSGGFAQRVDERTGDVGSAIQVGESPIDVAVGKNTVWVANRDGDSVTKIDAASGTKVDTYAVPGSPVAITVDPRTDAPWVYLGSPVTN